MPSGLSGSDAGFGTDCGSSEEDPARSASCRRRSRSSLSRSASRFLSAGWREPSGLIKGTLFPFAETADPRRNRRPIRIQSPMYISGCFIRQVFLSNRYKYRHSPARCVSITPDFQNRRKYSTPARPVQWSGTILSTGEDSRYSAVRRKRSVSA